MDNKKQLEQDLLKTLTEGEMDSLDPKRAAVAKLPTKVEVRILTEYDPVAEETKIIRKTVKEIDGLYDD